MLKKTALFFVLVLASQVSVADPYAGVKVGLWNYNQMDDLSFIAFAGYQFNPYLAVEAEYFYNRTGVNIRNGAKNRSKSTDAIVWIRPTLPIDNTWSLYAKGGAGKWNSQDTSYSLRESSSSRDGGTELYAGAGVEWRKDAISLHFETIGNKGFTVSSFGVGYSF